MSKIEKALRRARGERSLVLVTPASGQPVAEESKQIVPAPEAPAALSDFELRARSSASIALMKEPQLLDAAELALRGIIYPELSEDATVQAFREIRTKILQKTKGRNCIVMVTSVAGTSGNTFVSLNLGAAFAFDSGKTSLLVECNLRNPTLHKFFSAEGVSGLTDYLENSKLDVSDIIHPIGIERMRVVPAGGNREIPAEYFTSDKMKRFLGNAQQRYPERFIILDAPPMTESADTQILSELCDYVVLVVPYGRVTSSQLANCVKVLDSKKLLGVIFNNEPHIPRMSWHRVFGDLLPSPREMWQRVLDWVAKKKP